MNSLSLRSSSEDNSRAPPYCWTAAIMTSLSLIAASVRCEWALANGQDGWVPMGGFLGYMLGTVVRCVENDLVKMV